MKRFQTTFAVTFSVFWVLSTTDQLKKLKTEREIVLVAARTFRSRIFLPQKFARWLISSLCSFSCLNLATSLNARMVARPVKVSEKCAQIGDKVTLIRRFNSLHKENKVVYNAKPCNLSPEVKMKSFKEKVSRLTLTRTPSNRMKA